MSWQRILVDGRLQLRYVYAFDHPLPAFIFDRQRGTCLACERHTAFTSPSGDSELRCGLQGRRRVSCSGMRLAGAPCGPEAKHFTPTLERTTDE